MRPDELFSSLSSVGAAHLGTFLMFAVAPISLCLVFEGVVHVFRGRGLKPLLVATALTGGLLVLGLAVRQYGISTLESSPSFAASLAMVDKNVPAYAMISIPLALLAFCFRMVNLWVSRR